MADDNLGGYIIHIFHSSMMEGDTGQAVLTTEDTEPLLSPKEPLQRLSPPATLYVHRSVAFGRTPLPAFLTAHLI